MELVYIPSACKGEDKTFDGSVTIEMLPLSHRLRLIAKCKFQASAEGLDSKNPEAIEGIATLLDAVKKHVIKCELVHLASGKEFTSFESMEFDSLCDKILIEIATGFMNGFALGNG